MSDLFIFGKENGFSKIRKNGNLDKKRWEDDLIKQ